MMFMLIGETRETMSGRILTARTFSSAEVAAGGGMGGDCGANLAAPGSPIEVEPREIIRRARHRHVPRNLNGVGLTGERGFVYSLDMDVDKRTDVQCVESQGTWVSHFHSQE